MEYHWNTDTGIVSKITYLLRLYTRLIINTDIEKGITFLIQQILLKWLLYIRHITYCSYKRWDHDFKGLAEKSMKWGLWTEKQQMIVEALQYKQVEVSSVSSETYRGPWTRNLKAIEHGEFGFLSWRYVIPSKNVKERKPLNQMGTSVPVVGLWATAGKNVGKKGGWWQPAVALRGPAMNNQGEAWGVADSASVTEVSRGGWL